MHLRNTLKVLQSQSIHSHIVAYLRMSNAISSEQFLPYNNCRPIDHVSHINRTICGDIVCIGSADRGKRCLQQVPIHRWQVVLRNTSESCAFHSPLPLVTRRWPSYAINLEVTIRSDIGRFVMDDDSMDRNPYRLYSPSLKDLPVKQLLWLGSYIAPLHDQLIRCAH